ncbi:MAG: DUF4089 domain-containing protein [Alphaproteobacteria bacterium]|jgi:hypothetical protein|nr:DUF4089 domain-containing protein [Alphaproteobacteria bacterium]
MTEEELDARIDATAAQVGLSIAADHRPGVRRFLAIAGEMAATLDRVDLDADELALAPVYTPPED